MAFVIFFTLDSHRHISFHLIKIEGINFIYICIKTAATTASITKRETKKKNHEAQT